MRKIFSILALILVSISTIILTVSADNKKEYFVMLSNYNLEPFSTKYIENVLAYLGRNEISGIIYSSLGEISEKIISKGYLNEIEMNKEIYKRAEQHNANMVLQLRIYSNKIMTSDGIRTIHASEILENKEMRQAFRDRLKKEVYAYTKYFSGEQCKVIVFEEAGIYHHEMSGGKFWAYPEESRTKTSAEYDTLFAKRMTKLFFLINYYIKSINPECSVGMHLGHSVFLNKKVLKQYMGELKRKDSMPDFIFYDFYEKAQKTYESYVEKLTIRRGIIKDLGVQAYHLAQLHTMNDFQHGKGRTPSQNDISSYIKTSHDLNFDGFGFYGKNALPTLDNDIEAFDPNEKGQRSIYESSKDRWNFGMHMIQEYQGIDFDNYFYLVLKGKFGDGNYEVSLKGKHGNWKFIGIVDPNNKKGILGGYKDSLIVFHLLKKKDFMSINNSIEVKITDINAGAESDFLESISVHQSIEKFITVAELKERFRLGILFKNTLAFMNVNHSIVGQSNFFLFNNDGYLHCSTNAKKECNYEEITQDTSYSAEKYSVGNTSLITEDTYSEKISVDSPYLPDDIKSKIDFFLQKLISELEINYMNNELGRDDKIGYMIGMLEKKRENYEGLKYSVITYIIYALNEEIN